MTRGIIYYNTGKKCLVRLATTIYSLRKHYRGPVAILSEGEESHQICTKIAGDLGVDFKAVEFQIPEGAQPTFLKKTLLHIVSPYDVSVFIDSDSLITGDPTPLFDWAEKYEFVATQFSNWAASGRIMTGRINNWKPYLPEYIDQALKFGPALNAGVYAFRRDSRFMNDWFEKTLPGRHIHLPEETSMQVLLHRYPNYVAPQIYNCSCKHSDPLDPDVRIIHYHRNKHCRIGLPFGAELWMRCFERVLEKNVAGIKDWHLEWDGTLKRYFVHKSKQTGQKETPVIKVVAPEKPEPKKEQEDMPRPRQLPQPYIRHDVTLVGAISANLIPLFKQTVPTWAAKPQVAAMPLIIFTHGISDPQTQLRPYVKHKNVTFIPWEMPKYNDIRELMISSFVLGAARHVTTPYWLKLDLDTYFATPEDLFGPEHYTYDIVGHRWGQSFLRNIILLDNWADTKGLPGKRLLPVDTQPPAHHREKYGHARFISWACLHKTDFVKEAAALAGDRLPSESHDTFLWYIAYRLGRKWGGVKLNIGAGHSKRWGKIKAAYDTLRAWDVPIEYPA